MEALASCPAQLWYEYTVVTIIELATWPLNVASKYLLGIINNSISAAKLTHNSTSPQQSKILLSLPAKSNSDEVVKVTVSPVWKKAVSLQSIRVLHTSQKVE